MRVALSDTHQLILAGKITYAYHSNNSSERGGQRATLYDYRISLPIKFNFKILAEG